MPEKPSGNVNSTKTLKVLFSRWQFCRPFHDCCSIQYELRLVASDNLNENYTTVVIHVNDVNDNPPVFDRPTYETQITEEDDRNLPKRVLKVNIELRFVR